MAIQKITFTVKSINKNDKGDIKNTNVRVQDFDFSAEGDNVKIVRIYFIMHDQSQKSKLDILEEQQTYELTFDDGIVSVDKASKGGGNFASASAGMASGPESLKKEKKTFVIVNEENKEMRVIVTPEFQLKIAKQGSDQQQSNSSDETENTTETGNEGVKPETSETNTETGNDEKKPTGNKPTGNTDDTSSSDQSDNQPPKNPESTSEQVNNAKEKLDQAKTEKEIEDALKETQNTAKNSSDADLKKKKEEKERELGEQNKEKLREIIKEEVKNTLQENGIKPEDLSPSVKQKLDELNNNNNNNNNIETAQAQTIRTEIFNDMGVKSLEKLIAEVEQALKSGDKKKIKNIAQKLQEFSNSQIYYKKTAYQAKKDKVQQLLEKAKNHQPQQKNDDFFRPNNPVMWISGVAIIGLVAGVILVVRSRKRKVLV